MERITRLRVTVLLTLFGLLIGFFALKLYDLQMIQTGGNTDNVKKFYTVTRVKAARGDILDRNGNVLVTNRATYDMVFNHYVLLSNENPNGQLLKLVQLCRELGVTYNEHFPITMEAPFRYTLDEMSSSAQNHFQAYLPVVGGGLDSDISAPVLIRTLREYYKIPEDWSDADARAVIGLRYELRLRQDITNLPNYVFMEDVDNETLAAILELGTPGLNTEESMVRVYNTEYGAHILGYIGAITAKQWQEVYKGKDGYQMDALVGQSGLEEAFEEYLHGVDGYRVDVVTSDGTLIDQYYRKDPDTGEEFRPVAGKNVELTIDLDLQTTAEEQLDALITELRNQIDENPDDDDIPDGADAEGGSVVVMDVKTGQILACASYPTYNLSTFREDYSELAQDPYAPLFNRALQATYAPGSTYKMNMVIAGINSGAISSGTMITDQGVYKKYAGFNPKCLTWTTSGKTHGTIDAAQALCVSCNYFFYALADSGRLDWNIVDRTAQALGLGEATGVELFEYTGYRANAQTKKLLHTAEGTSGWYPADQITASIGQSDNKFTPMQLCVYTSTLANRGTRYKATFLNRVVSSDYTQLEYVNEPVIVSQFQISDDAYYAYTKGMRDVALTGTARSILKNYPIAVAAKTGTAETDSGGSDNGAFVCYAPYDDPEIAIVVYGEKAGHGRTMGQIAKALLDTYFQDELVGDLIPGENELG
jgi:penicillin-binding protein 2